jgi:NAD(P)-dependent dehydrogenase (short-subunit alcohol dehydrogenase family)
MGLNDKVAIVTGAAKGLGRAIVLALAEEGAQVIVADIDEDGAREVVDRVEAMGGKGSAITTDVSNSESVQAMVDEAIEKHGRIDVLVTNAGVVGPQGPWGMLTEEGFDYVTGVDFRGVYLSAKAAIPHMMAQKSGKIIHIASCAGKTGEQFNGVYSACKGAVVNMTQSMAAELGPHGINVNAVCPAAMDTDLMEKVYRERSEHFGLKPDELRHRIKSSYLVPGDLTVTDAANVVVFLASDKTNMMTGQAVNITGGIEMH